jgi:hypothetical protein
MAVPHGDASVAMAPVLLSFAGLVHWGQVKNPPVGGAGVIRAHLWLSAGLAVAIAGCSRRPSRMEAPRLDPEEVASRAMERYDTSGDGKLSGDELSPGLRAFAKTADKDKDGILTEAEIAERLAACVASRVGLQQWGGVVFLDGRPLPGATVRFIPDPVLEGIVEPASGRADAKGYVDLRIEGSRVPGVRPGFYRVEVSKKDAADRETLPARYNADSELGQEVGPDALRGGWKLELHSR